MATATWNGTVIAQSDDTVVAEGNHYFPKDSLKQEFFKPSDTLTKCPWKGSANYFSIEVDGKENPDAAWVYADPKEAAMELKDRVAFWRGVEVTP